MTTKDRLNAYDQYLDETIEKDIRDTVKQRAMQFSVDEHDFKNEVASQGAIYAYISNMVVVQSAIVNRASLAVSIVEAEIKRRIREQDPRSGKAGGPTVDQLDAAVKTNTDYQAALIRLRNAEDKANHLRADERASAQKARMLELMKDMLGREQKMKPYDKKSLKTKGED